MDGQHLLSFLSRKASFTWWQVVDLLSRNGLCWRLWRSRWQLAVSRRYSTPTRAVSSSNVFVSGRQDESISISWSGRKRCYVNILDERLWKMLKSKEVYLRAYSDGWKAEITLAASYGGTSM